MYDKEIYDQWKLHEDATQHEISFKFIEKVVKILSTTKLMNTDNKEVDDIKTLQRWKKISLTEVIFHFNKISNQPLQIIDDSLFIEETCIFIAKLINSLRRSNIKLNDIEYTLEPKLFKSTIIHLENKYFNQYFNILLSDILEDDEINIDQNVKLSLKIEDTINIRNTVWNLENLCITFKEISKWFKDDKKLNSNEKKYSLNLLLLYSMRNFYLRYINDLNGGIVNYNRIYITTTSFIKSTIREAKPFILICFKSIAIFLNLLIKKYNFNKNDSIIENYLSIINIYCNETNVEKLKNIIFSDLTIL